MECHLYGLGDTPFSLGFTSTHDSHATIAEHHLHIIEVEVHDAAHGDYLCYALGCDAECIIGLGKSIDDGEVGIDFAQTFVVDDQQGIHILDHTFHTIQRLIDLGHTLKDKGNGDDAHREDIGFAGATGHHRTSACARTSSHTGSNEDHASAIVEHVLDFLDALLGLLAAYLGIITCTQSVSEQEFVGDRRGIECLLVSIAHDIRDVMNTLPVHIVDSIVTAAAHTYHLDDG